MVCTFFGHRDTPRAVLPALKSAIADLIEHKGVDTFYFGNQGSFDSMVRHVLAELRTDYPHVKYTLVYAYLPTAAPSTASTSTYSVYPEELACVPPKYAIIKRNLWMIDRSDYVIAYVDYPFGGAAEFLEAAIKKGKKVINLGKLSS